MHAQNDTADTVDQHFAFRVNGVRHRSTDPVLDGRGLLRIAGFTPPSDHVLIELTRPGSRSIGLDEAVDLRTPGREEFRAFPSDRTFNFTVDEIGYEWGAGTISAAELRDIAGVGENKILVLEHKGAPDEELAEDASIELKARGAERLHTKKRLVTVTYGDDEKPFQLEPREYTGAELAQIFGVPCGYVVDLIIGGVFHPIGPDERVRVKNGMHFVSQPGKGSSS